MNFDTFLKIGKHYKTYSSKKYTCPYKKNFEIKAPKVLLIDEKGEKKGVIETKEAIEIAKSKELDLIEVAPNAKPPVAKLRSWSKFKYEQEKKRKESKTKSSQLKEMWFKPFIGDADLKHKLKKVKEFIKDKDSVKLTIRKVGRVQNQHLRDLMKKILKKIEEYAEPQGHPKFHGRTLGIIVIPRKTKLIKNEEQNEEQNKNTSSDKKKIQSEQKGEDETQETGK
ncbi:translation initiation factor IF-3 [Candidatus Dojkabacteria bacterium]|nr:translation initiation factor IF-3 [Candidatus Dojkabacteria bacterium]